MQKLDINENFKIIGNLIKKKLDKKVHKFELTSTQSGILIFILLNYENNINQRDIEKFFDLSNPTVNGILNRLQSKEFIKRVTNNNDKRSKNIIPLEKAFKFQKEIEEEKDSMKKNMLSNINEEDLNIFYSVLEKIKSNLKETY